MLLFLYAAFRPVEDRREPYTASVTPKPYNVVYVTSESFNVRHLKMFGYDKNTAPTLDQLASEGVAFTEMVNASSWTNESLVSNFTSLDPCIHKVYARMHSAKTEWFLPLEILQQLELQELS